MAGAGDRIVATSAVYGSTRSLLASVLGPLGIRTDFVDATGTRHSFIHLGELSELLDAQELRADDPRARFWREVERTLRVGVPAVNVCSRSV